MFSRAFSRVYLHANGKQHAEIGVVREKKSSFAPVLTGGNGYTRFRFAVVFPPSQFIGAVPLGDYIVWAIPRRMAFSVPASSCILFVRRRPARGGKIKGTLRRKSVTATAGIFNS